MLRSPHRETKYWQPSLTLFQTGVLWYALPNLLQSHDTSLKNLAPVGTKAPQARTEEPYDS